MKQTNNRLWKRTTTSRNRLMTGYENRTTTSRNKLTKVTKIPHERNPSGTVKLWKQKQSTLIRVHEIKTCRSKWNRPTTTDQKVMGKKSETELTAGILKKKIKNVQKVNRLLLNHTKQECKFLMESSPPKPQTLHILFLESILFVALKRIPSNICAFCLALSD